MKSCIFSSLSSSLTFTHPLIHPKASSIEVKQEWIRNIREVIQERTIHLKGALKEPIHPPKTPARQRSISKRYFTTSTCCLHPLKGVIVFKLFFLFDVTSCLCIDEIPEVAKTKVSKPKRYSLSKLSKPPLNGSFKHAPTCLRHDVEIFV